MTEVIAPWCSFISLAYVAKVILYKYNVKIKSFIDLLTLYAAQKSYENDINHFFFVAWYDVIMKLVNLAKQAMAIEQALPL